MARNDPKLQQKLDFARIQKSPAEYMKEAVLSALILAISVAFVIIILALGFGFSPAISILFFLIFWVFFMYYNISKPMYNALKANTYIDGEIVSMVRFLILEIKTEKSLYDALLNTSKNFVVIGIYLDEVIDKVKLGMTMEKALMQAVDLCPSNNLRNVYWQLLNSLQTGTDVTNSLAVLLEDVVEAQRIRIEEYGRELNALSLFYMMVAIIIPTVGFTIVAAILTFVGFEVPLVLLIIIWAVLSLVQIVFLITSSQRRPSVEAY